MYDLKFKILGRPLIATPEFIWGLAVRRDR